MVAALAAVVLVGLYANARQSSAMEAIRAMNAAGGDPEEIVFGSPPPSGEQGDCLMDEAAARGITARGAFWASGSGQPRSRPAKPINAIDISPAVTSATAPVAMNMSTKNPRASQVSAMRLIFE